MTIDEFSKAAKQMGYANVDIISEYVAAHGDKNYTLDDFIAVYRMQEEQSSIRAHSDRLYGRRNSGVGYKTSKTYKRSDGSVGNIGMH